jgi:UDP-glucuronate 4-epimerase
VQTAVRRSIRRDVVPPGKDASWGACFVTGAAGFIGMHVARRLLSDGHDVVGVDSLNAYYDPRLKAARIAELEAFPGFRFERIDIADRKSVAESFATYRFRHVVHLAAQAGVRHSLTDPYAYADANLTGFLNVLEGCRHTGCRHLVYASSSSVYGANTACRSGCPTTSIIR